jgi:hypothetical protein
MWDSLREWLDNPLLVKHLRSRLRVQPLCSSIVVVLILGLCIIWGTYELQAFQNAKGFEALVALQGLILVVLGAGQIGASVGKARASGILDFHRVSPLTPTELTLGFFIGAPIREYVLLACTLPFSAVFLGVGEPSWRGFVQIMILLVATAWIFHGLSMLNSLLAKGHAHTRGVAGLFVFALLAWFAALSMGRFAPTSLLFDEEARLNFFGVSMPWLTVVLLYQAPILLFIFLAARRKMASERIHPLSKPQAVGALALLGVLVPGGIWGEPDHDVLMIIALYALVGTALLLTLMVTPSRSEYLKGLFRARKQNESQLPAWDDLALNRAFLVIACGIVLVITTLLRQGGIAWAGIDRMVSYPLGIATGVFVIASFGLALQYFLLRFGSRGKMYFGLFLFVTWIVPLLTGTILLATMTGNDSHGQAVTSLSPVMGLGMIAQSGNLLGGANGAVQGAAITPVLFFAFVFNSLVTAERRRVTSAFRAAAAKAEHPARMHAEFAASTPA